MTTVFTRLILSRGGEKKSSKKSTALAVDATGRKRRGILGRVSAGDENFYRHRWNEGENNKQRAGSGSEPAASRQERKALTWLFGGDIDHAAGRTHSGAVVGPEGHVVGAAALQVPNQQGRLVPHRPDDAGRVLPLLHTPVLQLQKQRKEKK